MTCPQHGQCCRAEAVRCGGLRCGGFATVAPEALVAVGFLEVIELLFFVFGTGRCGSTPVIEVLARHRDVGFVSNVDDKFSYLNLNGRWNNTLFRRSAPRDPGLLPMAGRSRLFELGRLRISPSEGWEVLERQVSPMFSHTCRDLVAGDATPWMAKRVQGFFERRMAAQHKPVFGHHLTGWPRAGLLRAVFPEARFIHVIRDGRAVANSWLHMPWWSGYKGPDNWYLGPLPPHYQRDWEASGRSFVVLAGLAWKLLLDAFADARAATPPGQWLEVRFEDILTEPRKQFEAMLEFLNLDWTPAVEAGFTRYQFQQSRGDAFRRDLDPANLALLERYIGDRLLAYGYDLSARAD